MSAIKKEVTIGDCRLILGDCLAVISEVGEVAPPPEKTIQEVLEL